MSVRCPARVTDRHRVCSYCSFRSRVASYRSHTRHPSVVFWYLHLLLGVLRAWDAAYRALLSQQEKAFKKAVEKSEEHRQSVKALSFGLAELAFHHLSTSAIVLSLLRERRGSSSVVDSPPVPVAVIGQKYEQSMGSDSCTGTEAAIQSGAEASAVAHANVLPFFASPARKHMFKENCAILHTPPGTAAFRCAHLPFS